MASKKFTTPAVLARTVTFTIDDDEFEFEPGSVHDLLLALADVEGNPERYRRMHGWVRSGLTDEGKATLDRRLSDPADGLDTDTFGEVARWLIGQVTDRPTS